MKTVVHATLLSMLAIALLAACSSELKDVDDLPADPVLLGPHGGEYANPESADFHAKDISQHLGWDITSCRTCHGVDYNGGYTGVSCNTSGCHVAAAGGPEACALCHGDVATNKIYPQWYSSHATHLEGGVTSSTTIPCSNCHTLPENYSDPVHIDKTTPGKAEVHFSNVLAATQTLGTTGTPTFNDADATCANVYCHGNFTNGNNKTVAWKGADQAKCGSCHGDETSGSGLPPAPHPQSDRYPNINDCSFCHRPAIDKDGNPDPATHVNGILDVFGTQRTDW